MAPGHPVWVEFARAMVPMMGMPSEFIAGLLGAESGAKWKVLDIAAGHGMFGIAIARSEATLATCAVTEIRWSAGLRTEDRLKVPACFVTVRQSPALRTLLSAREPTSSDIFCSHHRPAPGRFVGHDARLPAAMGIPNIPVSAAMSRTFHFAPDSAPSKPAMNSDGIAHHRDHRRANSTQTG